MTEPDYGESVLGFTPENEDGNLSGGGTVESKVLQASLPKGNVDDSKPDSPSAHPSPASMAEIAKRAAEQLGFHNPKPFTLKVITRALEEWGGIVLACKALAADNELQQLRRELEEKTIELSAWHSQFGTSQLSHAVAKLQQAEAANEALAYQFSASTERAIKSEADTKRLNWLLARVQFIKLKVDDRPITDRAAIDAAMQK